MVILTHALQNKFSLSIPGTGAMLSIPGKGAFSFSKRLLLSDEKPRE